MERKSISHLGRFFTPLAGSIRSIKVIAVVSSAWVIGTVCSSHSSVLEVNHQSLHQCHLVGADGRSYLCDGRTCEIPLVDPEIYNKSPGRRQAIRAAIAAPFPLSSTFLLHSRSTATKRIYLDFDGHETTGTRWNTDPEPDLPKIKTSPFTMDALAAFSEAELTSIQEIWQRVAECFSPFDVDVTTEAPPVADLINAGGADTRWGIRVLFGTSNPDP
ncbi:MAG: hypothetical protein FJ267_14585, partial [Planctomycetes bacterium]|nr:hypothetical protein [Planctomycetota bacterium]